MPIFPPIVQANVKSVCMGTYTSVRALVCVCPGTGIGDRDRLKIS
uniref:Uncharacterized protein n=1 Tax=Anguilla anguilla TaxID=7936 RepID=A0A0E9P5C0_ANGAN